MGLAQYMQQQHLRVNALHAVVVRMEQGLLQGVRCIHLDWLLTLLGLGMLCLLGIDFQLGQQFGFTGLFQGLNHIAQVTFHDAE